MVRRGNGEPLRLRCAAVTSYACRIKDDSCSRVGERAKVRRRQGFPYTRPREALGYDPPDTRTIRVVILCPIVVETESIVRSREGACGRPGTAVRAGDAGPSAMTASLGYLATNGSHLLTQVPWSRNGADDLGYPAGRRNGFVPGRSLALFGGLRKQTRHPALRQVGRKCQMHRRARACGRKHALFNQRG